MEWFHWVWFGFAGLCGIMGAIGLRPIWGPWLRLRRRRRWARRHPPSRVSSEFRKLVLEPEDPLSPELRSKINALMDESRRTGIPIVFPGPRREIPPGVDVGDGMCPDFPMEFELES